MTRGDNVITLQRNSGCHQFCSPFPYKTTTSHRWFHYCLLTSENKKSVINSFRNSWVWSLFLFTSVFSFLFYCLWGEVWEVASDVRILPWATRLMNEKACTKDNQVCCKASCILVRWKIFRTMKESGLILWKTGKMFFFPPYRVWFSLFIRWIFFVISDLNNILKFIWDLLNSDPSLIPTCPEHQQCKISWIGVLHIILSCSLNLLKHTI